MFSDLLPRLVALVLWRGEIRLVDFTGVTDEGRDRARVGIIPLRRRLNDQAREIDAVLLEHRNDVEGRIGNDHGRSRPVAPIPFDRRLDLVRRELDRPFQPLQRCPQRIL